MTSNNYLLPPPPELPAERPPPPELPLPPELELLLLDEPPVENEELFPVEYDGLLLRDTLDEEFSEE